MKYNITKQIIVRPEGHSWLGFYSTNEKLNKRLNDICQLSQDARYKQGKWANAFWVLDLDGNCVAAQSTLKGAIKYYNQDRILVHYQQYFI